VADDEAFEIEEASVEALQASMASGSLTSRALTEGGNSGTAQCDHRWNLWC
jgi:hypothetical protein